MNIKKKKQILSLFIAGALTFFSTVNLAFAEESVHVDDGIRLAEHDKKHDGKSLLQLTYKSNLEEDEQASKTSDKKTDIKKLSKEVDSLRDELDSMTLTNMKILTVLNQLSERIDDLAIDQAEDRVRIPAPTDVRLVYPAYTDGESVSYTQDAINSQGNSTMVFTYNPDQLYKIYCRRGYLTDLAFRKGETIQFVGGGDTSGWSVSTSMVDGVPHLYIKPVVERSTTNLIVTTEKRSYQLILNTSDWYNPMVYWTYGAEDHAESLVQRAEERATRTASVNITSIDDLDFSYTVKGKGIYKPDMVFTDGSKVYLKYKTLPKQNVPFFIKEAGKKQMSLISYKRRDDYFIIDIPFEKLEMRVSEHEKVVVERNKERR